jgi:hypothetical protein
VPIGTFATVTSGSDGGSEDPSGGAPSDGAPASSSDGEGGDFTTTAAEPASCLEESFAGALDRTRWVPWNDADGSLAYDGALTIVPTTVSEQAVGIVATDAEAVPFVSARVRMRIVTAPAADSESELFLQMVQHVPATEALVSIGVYQGTLRATTARDDGSTPFFETVAQEVPSWIGIRVAQGQVDFEVSDDGARWDVLATAESPAVFPGVLPLVMVWNNPTVAAIDPVAVVVDDLSVCVE